MKREPSVASVALVGLVAPLLTLRGDESLEADRPRPRSRSSPRCSRRAPNATRRSGSGLRSAASAPPPRGLSADTWSMVPTADRARARPLGRRGLKHRLGRPADDAPARRFGSSSRCVRADRVAPPGSVPAATHPSLSCARRRQQVLGYSAPPRPPRTAGGRSRAGRRLVNLNQGGTMKRALTR